MKRGPPKDQSKENEAVSLFRSGFTLQEIADKFGVTRQMIGLRIKSAGLCASDGGYRLRAEEKKKERSEAADIRCIEKWGTTLEVMRRFRKTGIIGAYTTQKVNARKRGIAWELTFWQWWNAWQESGLWDLRGRGEKYVMARKRDLGPYSLGNIYFCTGSQNVKDAWIFNPPRRGKRLDSRI